MHWQGVLLASCDDEEQLEVVRALAGRVGLPYRTSRQPQFLPLTLPPALSSLYLSISPHSSYPSPFPPLPFC